MGFLAEATGEGSDDPLEEKELAAWLFLKAFSKSVRDFFLDSEITFPDPSPSFSTSSSESKASSSPPLFKVDIFLLTSATLSTVSLISLDLSSPKPGMGERES